MANFLDRVAAYAEPRQRVPARRTVGGVSAPGSWFRRQMLDLSPSEWDVETSLEFPAVGNCVRIVSREIARMDLVVEERVAADDGGDAWQLAPPDPGTMLLSRRWAPYVSRTKGVTLVVRSMCLHGFACVHIERSGPNVGLHVLDPAHVSRSRVGPDVQYRYGGWDLRERTVLDRRDIAWIDFDPPLDGISTVAPLAQTWDSSLRMAVGAARFAAKYMESGAVGNLFYYAVKTAAEEEGIAPEDYDQAVASIRRREGDMRASGERSMFLPEGIDVKKLSDNPQHAQLILLMVRAIQDICGQFGVPPMAVGELSRSTFANFGQGLRFLSRMTLSSLSNSIADELSAMLFPSGDRRLRFDLGKLGDESALEAAQRHKIYVDAGCVTANEVRHEIGLPASDDPQADVLARASTLPIDEFALGAPDDVPIPALPPGSADEIEEIEG